MVFDSIKYAGRSSDPRTLIRSFEDGAVPSPASLSKIQMNAKIYKKAKSYAYFLMGPHKYMDLVHDAYIKWYDKTGGDLFDQHEKVVISTIRNIVFNHRYNNTYMWNGGRHSTYICNGGRFSKTYYEYSSNYDSTQVTPEDILIEKDEREHMIKRLTTPQISIFSMISRGYSQNDIVSKTGLSPQLVSYFVKQIRKKWANN